ncbi:uncharacterized protein EV422DRAFT_362245 [Fimicolochytrium jonesii]|uniref:uncharacterized protein n=1 Tax=Fimicolochytrium jonesii TaxID=1396493 RepID=UPI0022FE3757|nr:uncharacterized protein EV422DRAFT_362245 [Fimicolochytrium jonesii]KAI8823611.1 hypothetical protein EV422DRAFT_362245 [Fimicolochytrium jonesii]
MSQNCGKCEKAVYPTEKIEAASKWYHKGCFKCSDPNCNIQLNLKTFKAVNDQIWCQKHTPQPKATSVADSVSVLHAMHAPKKTAEGLHKTTVGTGETPQYGLDTLQTQHALLTPKKSIENLGNIQKGDATTPRSAQAQPKSADAQGQNQGQQVEHEEIQV